MELPTLYIANKLPSLDGLERNTLYTVDINKSDRTEVEKYIFEIISVVLNKSVAKCKIQYRCSLDGNAPTFPNALFIITYLNNCSNNAFVTTDIDKDIQKYKSFSNKCKLYTNSVNTNNVVCYLSEHFHKMIGGDKSESFDIYVSFEGDGYIQLPLESTNSAYRFAKKDKKPIALNKELEMDYGFFNDLVYDGKLSFDHKEIVKLNGIFMITEHSRDDEGGKEALEQIKQFNFADSKLNRFTNVNAINGILTPTTCEWISQHMRNGENSSRIQLLPSKASMICDYIQFIIDNKLLPAYFKMYNISIDTFTFDVTNIVLCDIMQNDNDATNSDFSIDIAFSEINDKTGYCHNFNDGMCVSMNKGDCIIYASKMRMPSRNITGIISILRIEFKLNVRNNKIVSAVY